MKHFVLALVLGLGVAACSCTEERGPDSLTRTQVTGTVLDRSTGAPIADARVTLPDGREVHTNAEGRFVAQDLAVGLAGDLVAHAEDGREGRIVLRPLARRPLEVVVYAGR